MNSRHQSAEPLLFELLDMGRLTVADLREALESRNRRDEAEAEAEDNAVN